MSLHLISIDELKSNPDNPRIIKDDKFKQLVESLRKFPQMMKLRPIIYNADNIILGGNMRFEASKALKLKEVWAMKAEDLTPEQEKEFIIKDNVGFGEWNWDILANEWNDQELTEWGLDIPGFVLNAEQEEDLREEYSAKIGEVVYEPKNTNHKPEDLFTRETKFDAEIETIENAGIREMLRARTSFFSTFNFSRIADYYAYQASEPEKAIIEKLALVILDKDQLVKNGFSKIIETVQEENGIDTQD